MPPCDSQPPWQPGDVTHLVERPCSMLEVLVSTTSTMWAVLSCCGAGRAVCWAAGLGREGCQSSLRERHADTWCQSSHQPVCSKSWLAPTLAN